MPKPVIRDIDRGYKALANVYTKPGLSAVSVGMLEGEGNQREEGLTNVLLGGVHEFGREDGSIPARSWNRAFVDELKSTILMWIRGLAKKVERGVLTREQALGQLGLLIVAGMKKRVQEGLAPPLLPATIRRRKKGKGTGSAVPLIDTGEMINAITHRVEKA